MLSSSINMILLLSIPVVKALVLGIIASIVLIPFEINKRYGKYKTRKIIKITKATKNIENEKNAKKIT